MWAVDNQTPFSAERTFVRDRDGSEVFLVAVRATFDLFPDGSWQASPAQDPVALAPQYLGQPGRSSLRCDTDLPRTKLGTDVILNASAHAPHGADDPVEVEVGFRVGDLLKRLVVSGDAVWQRNLGAPAAGRPQPFASLPITYERAFGGQATADDPATTQRLAAMNPIGVGIDRTEGCPVPNVRYPGTRPDRPAADKPVAGLGAVSCAWLPRRELAGTYDETWQQERQPLLPDDFQDEYYYAAPADQVVPGYLRGGEEVELHHLTPDGILRFNLPKYSFGFRTQIGGGVQHHRARLHTVLIEPDQQRLILVWHTALPCHHTLYTLTRTIVFQKRDLSHKAEVAA